MKELTNVLRELRKSMNALAYELCKYNNNIYCGGGGGR